MFVNQRTLIAYENAEKRIAELEALLAKLGQGKLIQLKTINSSNISERLDGLEHLANELLTQQERRCSHEELLIARTRKRQVSNSTASSRSSPMTVTRTSFLLTW